MTSSPGPAAARANEHALLDDRELTIAFQNGNDSVYDVIHERYSARVQRICRRMLMDSEDAREASQETFLRVYAALGRFNGRYQLGAWITRIATNVCLDHLRVRTRHPEAPLPEGVEPLAERSSEDDPEFIHLRNNEAKRVHKVLASLPPMHRAAIMLRDLEGLSYGEIAISLDLSESQVKALLHRARKGFRRSWPSLAALLPTRWIRRLRDLDSPLRDQATQVFASSPQVTSCSVMLQQCGQVMSERVAAVVVTAVVGAASVAGGIPPAQEKAPQIEDIAVEDSYAASVDYVDPGSGGQGDGSKPTRADVPDGPKSDPGPEPDALPTEEEPTSEEPSTDSAPEPPPSDDGSAPPPGEPTTNEPVAAFAPSLYFGEENPGGDAATSQSAQIDCWNHSLRQTLETTVWINGARHPALLDLAVDVHSASVGLRVTYGGRNYHYVSWGETTPPAWTADGDWLTFNFQMDYGSTYGEDPSEAGLPSSGAVTASAKLDCATSTVVTESIGFTAS